MNDVNLRGFAYPLQALMQRKQWQTDQSMRELALAQRHVQRASDELSALAAAYSGHAGRAREAWQTRPDPASYQRLLSFLAHQEASKVQLEAQLAQVRETCRKAQEDCIARQCALEGLRRHRKDSEDDYAAGERARQLTRADDDWAMRPAAQHAGAAP